MAAAEIPLLSGAAPKALVPGTLLDAAARHPGDGTVALTQAGSMLGVTTDEYRLSGRALDYEFPAWRNFIAEPHPHRAIVEITKLAEVVTHMQLVAETGEHGAVQLTFGDTLDAVAMSGTGRSHAETDCTMHGGGPFEIVAKPSYLRETLAAISGDHVSIHIAKKRAELRPCAADGELLPGYAHVVMGRKALGS